MTISLEMTDRGDGTGVSDVAVIHDGTVVSSYTVDPLGRKIEPLSDSEYIRARVRIGQAAMELWDRMMDGGPLGQYEQVAIAELVKIQLEMGIRGR